MLQRISNFSLPEQVAAHVDRAMLAIGVAFFASAVLGTLIT